eukprot:jgi/Hompol1/6572/HPOL_002491-RA
MGLRSLSMKIALKKSVVLKRKAEGIPVNAEEIQQKTMKAEQDLAKMQQKLKVVKDTKEDSQHKPAVPATPGVKYTTVHISNLPNGLSQKQLYKKLRKLGTIVGQVVFPIDDSPENQHCARVVYETDHDARNAHQHLDQHIFKGNKLVATLVGQRRGRLIIRNLAFYCKPENLQAVFSPFGTIKSCSVPHLPDGKARGYGFVEFESAEAAERAIEGVNGTKILNRPVAVDWALDKTTFEKLANIPGTTLFIRNLSFETSEETVQAAFETFGPLRYAKIVKNKTTGLSAGTAFVCYKNPAHASACLDAYEAAHLASQTLTEPEISSSNAIPLGKGSKDTAKDKKSSLAMHRSILQPEVSQLALATSTQFIIDGRFVNVTLAVTRSQADGLKLQSSLRRRAEDKRNLYLMTEGVIFPDSPAAQLITPAELERRQQAYTARKKLLASNPNLYISKTRLSIRGIPQRIQDTDLRRVALRSVIEFWKQVESGMRDPLEPEIMREEEEANRPPPSSQRRIVVKQAVILKEKDRVDPKTGKLKSKGFGFVEFVSHADAIACLRYMNNLAGVFDSVEIPTKSHKGKGTTGDGDAGDGDGDAIEASVGAVQPKSKKGKKTPTSDQHLDDDGVDASAAPEVSVKAKRPIVEFAIENKLVVKKRQDRVKAAKTNTARKDSASDDVPAEGGKGAAKANPRGGKTGKQHTDDNQTPKAKKTKAVESPKTTPKDASKSKSKSKSKSAAESESESATKGGKRKRETTNDATAKKPRKTDAAITSAPVSSPDTPAKITKSATPAKSTPLPTSTGKVSKKLPKQDKETHKGRREIKREKLQKADQQFESLVEAYRNRGTASTPSSASSSSRSATAVAAASKSDAANMPKISSSSISKWYS